MSISESLAIFIFEERRTLGAIYLFLFWNPRTTIPCIIISVVALNHAHALLIWLLDGAFKGSCEIDAGKYIRA